MKNIAVIGAGTMGSGIAQVLTLYGFKVVLVDIKAEILERGMASIEKNMNRQIEKATLSAVEKALSLLSGSVNLEEAVKGAEIVIEAIAEIESAKMELFKKLNDFTDHETVLASNTSSISITKLASVTSRPEKVIGMHFMNPVPVMQLVEVVKGLLTGATVVKEIMQMTRDIGKEPVLVNDFPGFVSNRVLMPMINEAIFTVYEGVSGVKQVDTVMQLGMAHPMGPLKLADFIGLDVCLDIMNVLYQGFGSSKYAPCPLLVKMVNGGYLGVKSGGGFYDWAIDRKNPPVNSMFN